MRLGTGTTWRQAPCHSRPLAVAISAESPAPRLPPQRNTRNSQAADRKHLIKEAYRTTQRQGTLPSPTQYTIPTAPADPTLGHDHRRRNSKASGQATYFPSAVPATTPAALAVALNISQQAATRLLDAAPVLQEVPPQHLHESMVYLILLLGAPTDAILRVAQRHPDALTMPQSVKQADKLGFLCYLQQRPRLLEALTHPSFLPLCRPNCFLHQVCHISDSLDVPLEAAIDMLVACPSLVALTQPPERLRALAGNLASHLDLHHPDYLRSCLLQSPDLLLTAAAGGTGWAELQARAEWLRHHGLLGRQLAAVPRLLRLDVQELEAGLQRLQATLDLPFAMAANVASQMPLLLLVSKGALATRLATLERLLEVDTVAAQQLAATAPRLLTDRAGAAHSCLLLLRQILSLEGERLQVVVQASPQLLAQPSQLRGNCLSLVLAVTSCSRWRSELASMPLSSLPWVLQQPELHTRRLLYLMRTHRTRTTGLISALAMSDSEFRASYPGYYRWCRGRLPPLKLSKQQVLAFRGLVRALPLHPEPQLPGGRRGRQVEAGAYDDGYDADY